MGRYVVSQKYYARRDGLEYGPWRTGIEIELSDFDAEWVNRDAPGTLTPHAPPTEAEPAPAEAEEAPVEEPEPAERDATPAKDRMHRGGRRRAAT